MALEATNPDGSHRTRTDRLMGAVLSVSAQQWPTPTAAEGTKIPSAANYGQLGLSNHPAIVGLPTRPKGQKSRKVGSSWTTPQTSDANTPHLKRVEQVAMGEPPEAIQLREQVLCGPPRGASGPADPASRNGSGNLVGSWATPRALEIETGQNAQGGLGLTSQVKSTQAGKLNPRWVEALQGLPLGWTQLPHRFKKGRK